MTGFSGNGLKLGKIKKVFVSPLAIRDRFGNLIYDRSGSIILSRV